MARQGSAEEGGFVPERIKPNLSSSSLSAVTSSARGTHGRDSRTLSTPPAGTQARSCPSCCRPTYDSIFMPTPPTHIHTYMHTNKNAMYYHAQSVAGRRGSCFLSTNRLNSNAEGILKSALFPSQAGDGGSDSKAQNKARKHSSVSSSSSISYHFIS